MNPEAGDRRHKLIEAVDQNADSWRDLALRIHSNPETGRQEFLACEWLAAALSASGFSVETGLAGLPTAFTAIRGTAGPKIALLAEYDALPELGHACGHNLICAAAGLAAVGLSQVARPHEARIGVIGCPAEEDYGGKIQLIEQGVFADFDVALMAHGYRMNLAARPASGRKSVVLEFFGKSAHAAAAPQRGTNALDAMIQTFVAVGLMRQQFQPDDRVHGIITHGGKAANIIPDYTRAEFYVRSFQPERMEELGRRLVACARGAAEATGVTLHVSSAGLTMLPIRHNATLAGLYAHNMRLLGAEVGEPPDVQSAGSTDFGNVSQLIPALHGYFKIADSAQAHTPEFAAAAASDEGLAGMVLGAKALALTALDLAQDPSLLAQARAEHHPAG